MNADIRSLFQLFESLEGEVRGREAVTPPLEVATLLNALLAGQLRAPAQRKEAFELLRANPGWLEWFAGQIKSRHSPAE